MKTNMDIPYEKMPPSEDSSVVLVDEHGPIPVREAPVRVRHYFGFSLFSALCLCPATGLIALAYSLKSSAKADVKFHDKARLYSRRALLWNLASVVFAVLSFVLAMIFCYYFNQMMTSLRYTDFNESYRSPMSNQDLNKIDQMVRSLTNN